MIDTPSKRLRLTWKWLAWITATAISSVSTASGCVEWCSDVGPLSLDSPLSAAELVAVLDRVGISAESLAVAGGDRSQAEFAILAGRSYLEPRIVALRETQQLVDVSRGTVEQLRNLIQSGLAADNDVEAFATAMEQLRAASELLESELSSVFSESMGHMTQRQQSLVRRVNTNRNHGWTLPLEYLVLDEMDTRRLSLQDAIAHERFAVSLGESPSSEALAIINYYESLSEVGQAQSNLRTHLEATTDVWNRISNE